MKHTKVKVKYTKVRKKIKSTKVGKKISTKVEKEEEMKRARDEKEFPIGVCVKVKSLRQRLVKVDNLEEWMVTPQHVLVCRAGRVFVGNGKTRKVFHYPTSEFANPFKVKEYGLDKSLVLYQSHLNKKLEDDDFKKQFLSLSMAKEIGCFCDIGSKCHRDIILKKLKELASLY